MNMWDGQLIPLMQLCKLSWHELKAWTRGSGFTGCPTKHGSSKNIWRSCFIFEMIYDIYSYAKFKKYNFIELIVTKYPWSTWHFQNVVWLFLFSRYLLPEIWLNLFKFRQFWFCLSKLKSERNSQSPVIYSTADHILEISGPGEGSCLLFQKWYMWRKVGDWMSPMNQ